MHTSAWKYIILRQAMSLRLVEGGASEGCRPKLPRWPFSGSSCTQALGTALHGSMVGSHARRVKLFCATPCIFVAPRAERLVVAGLLSVSFLAPSPHHAPRTAPAVSGSAPRQHKSQRNQLAKEKRSGRVPGHWFRFV